MKQQITLQNKPGFFFSINDNSAAAHSQRVVLLPAFFSMF